MNSLLTTIFTLHFFNDGIRTAFVTLLPFISKELQLTFTQVGFLGAAQGMISMLLAIPMGIITSKIHGLKLLFLSVLMYSFCALGIGLSPSFFVLFIFFYLAAVAFAPFHIIGQSTTARSAPKDKRGTVFGTFATVGDLGRIALPAVALLLANFFGWRDTYISIAFLGLAVFVVLLLMIRNRQHIFQKDTTFTVEDNSKDWLKQMLLIFRQKQLVLITLAGLLDGIGGAGIYVYLPFLFLAKGVTHAMLALYMGVYFAGSLLGKKYMGKSIDFYGPAKIFMLAEILMAILMIILTLTNYLLLLLLITFILGLFTRGTSPVVMTLFTTVSHEAHYEKVYTISEIFLGGAAVLSPIILGRTADIFTINYSFYLAAGFAILATIPIYFYAKSKAAL